MAGAHPTRDQILQWSAWDLKDWLETLGRGDVADAVVDNSLCGADFLNLNEHQIVRLDTLSASQKRMLKNILYDLQQSFEQQSTPMQGKSLPPDRPLPPRPDKIPPPAGEEGPENDYDMGFDPHEFEDEDSKDGYLEPADPKPRRPLPVPDEVAPPPPARRAPPVLPNGSGGSSAAPPLAPRRPQVLPTTPSQGGFRPPLTSPTKSPKSPLPSPGHRPTPTPPTEPLPLPPRDALPQIPGREPAVPPRDHPTSRPAVRKAPVAPPEQEEETYEEFPEDQEYNEPPDVGMRKRPQLPSSTKKPSASDLSVAPRTPVLPTPQNTQPPVVTRKPVPAPAQKPGLAPKPKANVAGKIANLQGLIGNIGMGGPRPPAPRQKPVPEPQEPQEPQEVYTELDTDQPQASPISPRFVPPKGAVNVFGNNQPDPRILKPAATPRQQKPNIPTPPIPRVQDPPRRPPQMELPATPTSPNERRPSASIEGRGLPPIPAGELPPIPAAEQSSSVYDYEWYHGLIQRAEASRRIEQAASFTPSKSKEGIFLVRQAQQASERQPFSITLFGQGRFWQLPVRKRQTDNKFALGTEKPSEKVFSSVPDLVSYYTDNELSLEDKDTRATFYIKFTTYANAPRS